MSRLKEHKGRYRARRYRPLCFWGRKTDETFARILFSATVADVWACDGAALSITVQIGSVRATAEMPLEVIGTLMSGNPGHRLQSPRRR